MLCSFNVGGAVRYESRGAIGYYGLQQLPDIITGFDYTRNVAPTLSFHSLVR